MEKINQLPLRIRILLSIVILVIPITIVILQLNKLFALIQATHIDYMSYWTFARIFLTGGNPYDPAQLFTLQKAMEPRLELPIITWYPPWSLAILSFFGLLGYEVSHIVWLIFNVLILLISTGFIWKMCKGKREHILYPLLFVVTFAPVAFSLYEGQINILILFGLASFLYFLKQGRYTLAGIFVAVSTIKPQLLLIFWFIVLLWILKTRKYQLLASIIITIGLLLLMIFLFDRNIFREYVQVLIDRPPGSIANMSINGLLMTLTGKENILFQYVPLIAGLCFGIYYWIKNYERWDWLFHGGILIFISVLTSPYAWLHDQVLFIIPILFGISILIHSFSKISRMIVIAYVLVDFCMFVILIYDPHRQYYYLWIPIFLFLGCLYIIKQRNLYPQEILVPSY